MGLSINRSDIYKFSILTIALLFAFWFISFFELIVSKSSVSEDANIFAAVFYKMLNDFWFVIILGLIVFPFFLFTNSFSNKLAYRLVQIMFALFVLIQYALVKYSLTTLVNLGADLLGYSGSDIVSTVSASQTFSVGYFLPFIIFPLLFIGIHKIVDKYFNERILIGGAVLFVLLFGSSKLMFSNASQANYQNKLAFFSRDIIKFQNEKRLLNAYISNRNDYPLIKPFSDSKDVLGSFFNIKEEKPNIVVIIVEGLGSEFIGDKTYGGFTPYLDGLISKSLYWENFLSNTGRTFGVVPSLLGSLPYGETGFLELQKTPSHMSLISVLKANGYATSYYSGDQSSFDKKINFFEYNDIDNIIDENKFGPEYIKTEANSGGFSWGYPDAEIFRKTLASLDDKKQPRLDVIMTLSNHEPFSFPLKDQFELKVDSILNSGQKLNIPKQDILENKDIYTTLFYTDNAIKDFMTAYEKRSDFDNTIFVITGDHRLIPVAQKDKLCRFHVPLYIYSPMLKKPEVFKSVSSHWDVTPSLLSFLMKNYKFNDLEETAWMSEGLDTARQFRNIHKIPLMRYKGSINDFVYKDYLFSDGELYKINENFGTYQVKEEDLVQTMADSLMAFKKLNAYLTKRNKIFPDSLNFYGKPKMEFSKEQLAVIENLTEGLNFDQTFQIAKEKAFNKDRKTARLLCDYILNELPNHSDARTLKGRTLAWDGNYANAEQELQNVIKRAPFYYDSYLALLDVYWWSTQESKSEEIYKQALNNKISNPEVAFKMAKASARLQNPKRASQLIDSIISVYPNNSDYKTFKNTLQ